MSDTKTKEALQDLDSVEDSVRRFKTIENVLQEIQTDLASIQSYRKEVQSYMKLWVNMQGRYHVNTGKLKSLIKHLESSQGFRERYQSYVAKSNEEQNLRRKYEAAVDAARKEAKELDSWKSSTGYDEVEDLLDHSELKEKKFLKLIDIGYDLMHFLSEDEASLSLRH